MMRLSTRHWLIAMLLALALHLGVAVGLLLPTEESGARAVGTGGLAVSLSAGGAAPGAVPTVPSEPVSETVKTDQAETVPPDQTTPQTPPAEQVAALPVPTPDSPPPPDALPVLPPATPTEAAPAPVSTKPVEAEAVTPVETPPAKVDTADAKPPRETVAEAVTPPVPRARPSAASSTVGWRWTAPRWRWPT
jgi:protein TonB